MLSVISFSIFEKGIKVLITTQHTQHTTVWLKSIRHNIARKITQDEERKEGKKEWNKCEREMRRLGLRRQGRGRVGKGREILVVRSTVCCVQQQDSLFWMLAIGSYFVQYLRLNGFQCIKRRTCCIHVSGSISILCFITIKSLNQIDHLRDKGKTILVPQYSTAQYSTVQYSAVQYSTV